MSEGSPDPNQSVPNEPDPIDTGSNGAESKGSGPKRADSSYGDHVPSGQLEGAESRSPESPMKRRAIWFRWVKSIVVVYVLVHVGLFFYQREMLYIPYQDCELPERARNAGVEEVWLETRDGLRLGAWYWPSEVEGAPTAIIFHGNAGHRGHRLRWLRELHRMGLGAVVFDYRGYGDNPGSPHEEGLYLDAESAIDWVERTLGKKKIYFGYSLGSGVAVEMARRHPPLALILQAPFLSIPEVAAEMYPFLWVRPMVRDRYENFRKIDSISVPLLIMHGDADQIVPVHQGQRLFELAREPKELWIRPGRRHEGLVDQKEYRPRVVEFLQRYDILD